MKILLVLLLLFPTRIGNAESENHWSPPFSDDIYQLLSGVWDPFPDVASMARLENFSWGSSFVSPNFSRTIDLRATKPFLLMMDGFFEILSIDRIAVDKYRIDLKVIASVAESGEIIVHILGKDRIRFEDRLIPKGSMGLWFEKLLYRHYGPGMPSTEGSK